MRLNAQKLALPACRYFHSAPASALAFSLPIPRPSQPARQFHRTTSASLPRRRNFFTSNQLLQQQQQQPDSSHGSEDGQQPAAPASESLPQPDGKQQPPAAKTILPKRKSSTAGKPARRIASIAHKPVRTRPSRTTSARALDTSDDESRTKISAVCAAGGFNMDAVASILQLHGFALDPDGTGFDVHDMVHARGHNGGDIFVFPTGTVVGWALPANSVAALATRTLLPAAEEPHAFRTEEEDLDFEIDATSERSYIRGDKVVLGAAVAHNPDSGTAAVADAAEQQQQQQEDKQQELTLAKVAFSAGLARSTKLAVLEASLESYISGTRKIPLQLARGRPSGLHMSRRFVLQKTGELVLLRAQLNHQGGLTDSLPDMLWDSRSELGLEGYYSRVCRALDVDLRIELLNDRVTYANEIAGVLREISAQKHSARLEWIIIALIAVEVLIEFRRMYMEHTTTTTAEKQLEHSA